MKQKKTEMAASGIWEKCLDIIGPRVNEKGAFETWFVPVRAINYERGLLSLSIPNKGFLEILEGRYYNLLVEAIQETLGNDARIEYRVVKESAIQKRIREQTAQRTNKPAVEDPLPNSLLNPQVTFETYLEGKCNRAALGVAQAIARDPGRTPFNPFILHGQPGTGKTHLLNALGNEILKQNHATKVILVDANTFLNQYTEAARSNKVNDFVHFYQQVDVLLVDDIHDFAGKTKTQDTFCKLFNYLCNGNKQIVMSCDKPPAKLEGMEERLLSRLRWGIILENELPDEETKRNILTMKLLKESISLGKAVMDYIIQAATNFRELEGIAVSLFAHSIYNRREITLSLAREVVSNVAGNEKKVRDVRISSILEAVAGHFSLHVEDINKQTRKREIVEARQVAMYFAKKYGGYSLAAIGKQIGKRDHATVAYAHKRIGTAIGLDPVITHAVEEVKKRLAL